MINFFVHKFIIVLEVAHVYMYVCVIFLWTLYFQIIPEFQIVTGALSLDEDPFLIY